MYICRLKILSKDLCHQYMVEENRAHDTSLLTAAATAVGGDSVM